MRAMEMTSPPRLADRATGDARARAARHDRHPAACASRTSDLNLGGRARQGDQVGHGPIEAVVVLVHDDVFGRREDHAGAERALSRSASVIVGRRAAEALARADTAVSMCSAVL